MEEGDAHLLVAENLLRRTLEEVEPTDFVTPTVEKWASWAK